MQRWSISHSKDGFTVNLRDAKWWVPTVESFVGHVLCAHRSPRFLWEIPVGRAQRDGDDYLENSVAAKLLDAENELWRRLDHAQGKPILSLPITDDQARILWPDYFDDLALETDAG
jgi:hypothetical protein